MEQTPERQFYSPFRQPDAPSVLTPVSLITVERRAANQRPYLIGRVLLTLARLDIPVLLVSQSSYAGNFCVVIPQVQLDAASEALSDELQPELDLREVMRLTVKKDAALLRASPGYCEHLAAWGINILVIAQGSGGRDVSLVIESRFVPHILAI